MITTQVATLISTVLINVFSSFVWDKVQQKDFEDSILSAFDDSEKFFKQKYSEIDFYQSFVVRECNLQAVISWIKDENIEACKPEITPKNFDGTIATIEQVDYFVLCLKNAIKKDPVLSKYTTEKVTKDIFHLAKENNDILSSQVDKNVLIKSLNSLLNTGDFISVENCINGLDGIAQLKNLVILYKIKLRYFKTFAKDTSAIHSIITRDVEEEIIDDCIAFMLMSNFPRNDIQTAISLCKNRKLQEVFDLEEQYFDISETSGLTTYALKGSLSNESLYLNLALKQIEDINVSNACELMEKTHLLEYNFINEFRLNHRRISNKINIMISLYQEPSKEFLAEQLHYCEKTKEKFGYCCSEISIPFYRFYLWISSLISFKEYQSTKLVLPDYVKEHPSIVEIDFSCRIEKQQDIPKIEEINELCNKLSSPALWLQFLSFIDDREKVLVLEDYRFLAKKDSRIFLLYYNAVKKVDGEEYANKIIVNYQKIDEIADAILFIQSQSNPTRDNLSKIREMLQARICSFEIGCKLLGLLYIHGDIDFVIDFLRHEKNSSRVFDFDLAQYLMMTKTSENIKEAQEIVESLFADGYSSGVLLELYAAILSFWGNQNQALLMLEQAYAAGNKKTAIVSQILRDRCSLNKYLDDDILKDGTTRFDIEVQYWVYISYIKLSNESNGFVYLKRSLLLCKHYDATIYNTFLEYTLMHQSAMPSCKSIAENTAICLNNEDKNILVMIHSDSLLTTDNGCFFGGYIHINSEDELFTNELLYRQVGQTVNLLGETYTIESIDNADTVLSYICMESLIQNGMAKPFQISTDDPIKAREEIYNVLEAHRNDTESLVKMYTEPVKAPPISFYMLSEKLGIKYIETVCGLINDQSKRVWSVENKDTPNATPKYLLTYNSLVFLKFLNVDNLVKQTSEKFFVSKSTVNVISEEYEHLKRKILSDNIKTLVTHNGDVSILEDSDEVKRKNLSFITGLKQLSESLTQLSSNTDITLDLKNTNMAEILGSFDYDSLVVAKENNFTLVTDDVFLSVCCDMGFININYCCVDKILQVLDLSAEQLLDCFLILKNSYYFSAISLNSFFNLSQKIALTSSGEIEVVCKKLNEFLSCDESTNMGKAFGQWIMDIYTRIFKSDNEWNVYLINTLQKFAIAAFSKLFPEKVEAVFSEDNIFILLRKSIDDFFNIGTDVKNLEDDSTDIN